MELVKWVGFRIGNYRVLKRITDFLGLNLYLSLILRSGFEFS